MDAIWRDNPPPQHRAAIQNQISRLRATYGERLIVTSQAGYALGCETDAQVLLALTREAEERLAAGDAETAFARADAAADIGAGEAYTEIEHLPTVSSARRVLAAARHGVENLRVEAAVQLGRTAWAVVEAERLAEQAPFDERRQALRIRALLRAGRRGDALTAVGTARRRFRLELGVDPGPLITRAEAQALGSAMEGTLTERMPLEGREAELRAVLTMLARESLVKVSGEPGGGVTRMLAAVCASLHTLGVRTLSVDADEYLESAVGVLTAVVDEATGLGDDARGVVAGFADAVELMAEPAPIAIVIDDADTLGASARRALAEAATRERVMVVFGEHPPRAGEGSVSEVRLPRLDREAVTRIAARHTSSPAPSPADIDRLLSFSGGNPLLIEAAFLAGWPVEPNDLAVAGDGSGALGDTARIARWAEDLLDGLDEAQHDVLRRAAVAGDDFPVAALVDDADVRPPSGLLDLTDGARFVHGALRDQILRTISPAQREEMHAMLGYAARRIGAHPALVAHHLLKAADLAPGDAVAAGRAAAAEASRAGAHADTADWLKRCLAVAGRAAGERLGIRIELGDALRLAGDPAHLEVLSAAASDALELEDAALISAACFALLQLGATTTSGALLPQIPPLVTRALAVLSDPETRAPVCAAASLAYSLVGDAEQSRAHFAEADALARGDSDRSRVLPFAYMALGAPEDLDARAAAAEELAEIAARIESAPAAYEAEQLRFSVALQSGDGQIARAAVARMGELIDDVGDVGRRWALLFARAAIAHLDGDTTRCILLTRQAEALFAPVSPARASVAALGQLIALHLADGELHRLAPTLEETATRLPGIPALHAATALATAADAPAVAATHAAAALDRAQRDATWLAAHVVGARAVAQLGDTDLARRYLERLAPWAGRCVWQGTCSYGPVDTALALLHRALGEADASKRHAVRAAEAATDLGAHPFFNELALLGLASG